MIQTAVADVSPPAGALLDQTHRAGGARPLFEWQLRAELHDFIVRAAERQMQESHRIEQRLRGVPEGIHDHLLSDLRGAGPVRVSAHAVDHHQQGGVLSDRGGNAVLVFLTPAQQADVRVLDPQGNSLCLLESADALYHQYRVRA